MMPATAEMIDIAAIRAHLGWLTRRWPELGEPAWLELRALGEGVQPHIGRWRGDAAGLDEAAEWAASMNKLRGRNIYPVVNPLRDTRGRDATDADVIASIFHWADADSADATARLKSWGGPKWRGVVRTGSVPHDRVHVYWELREWQRDLAAWRGTQQAIARQFGSDGAVINPSRIMRLAGTISWPAERKVARGYVSELATLRSFDDREMVETASFARAFGGEPAACDGFSFDTEERHRGNIEDALRRCSIDGQKHSGVRDAAAMLAARGADRTAVEFIIRQACPVWDDNVENLITTAFQKYAPRPATTQAFDFKPEDAERSDGTGKTWRVESAADFVAGFVAPEYLIDGVVQRGRLYTLTAPTGSGKTAVMLYAAAMIAAGEAMCGKETEAGSVLFLAGENPDDVRARVIATLDHYGLSPAELPLYVVAGTFSIRADMDRLAAECERIGDVCLVVVDTFAAYFDGDDENSNAQALDFARVVRRLTQLPSKPTVVMPAHPVKNASRGNLTPKGGSSLLNEVDGNLTLWNDEGRAKLHWQGKHRGPDFDPLMVELVRVENSKIHDKHGRIMPSVVAKPISEIRATEIAAETFSLEDRLLMQIEADPALSIAERCARLGLVTGGGNAHKSKLHRTLLKLREEKLIRNFRGRWELTKDGERAVELARGGAPKGAEIE